jgi:hypothetical protein
MSCKAPDRTHPDHHYGRIDYLRVAGIWVGWRTCSRCGKKRYLRRKPQQSQMGRITGMG